MIGNDGAVLLAAMLEENASLVEVCLDSNYIGLGGKDALAEALANNKSVRAAAQCRPPQDRSHRQAQADKQALASLCNSIDRARCNSSAWLATCSRACCASIATMVW